MGVGNFVRAYSLMTLFSANLFAYTPNNFYPALRGSTLLLRMGPSSRQWPSRGSPLGTLSDRKPAQLQTQRGLSYDDSDEAQRQQRLLFEPGEFPLVSPRDKRLMGIFRCYGWGPGCTDSSFLMSKQSSSHSGSISSAGKTIQNRAPVSTKSDPLQSPQSQQSAPATTKQQRTSAGSGNGKFEPFFTLTSGGSWGPTGRKRSSVRRYYSVAEKRLDFLKQILRDMLEDIDDSSESDFIPLGIHRRMRRIITNPLDTDLLPDDEADFDFNLDDRILNNT